jgi:methionine-rich copper-binding protein CopC
MPLPSSLRILAVILLLMVTPALTAGIAAAHAVIIDSTPAVDATVAGDSDVNLHFNSRIDHQRSRLTLIAPDGSSSSLPIMPNSAPDIVAAKLTGLAPGQYRLRWQVLAIDGHLTRGDIRFSVKAP